MNELKKEMKSVVSSPNKPIFIYLLLDDLDNSSYTPQDNFSDYLNYNENFEWLRKMKIFSKIYGCTLPPRSVKTGFGKKGEHEETVVRLKKLIYKILIEE